MKKILGVIAICLVSLFMLASCNTKVDNSIPNPTITESNPEPEYKVLYDIETAETKYIYFYNENKYLYAIDIWGEYKRINDKGEEVLESLGRSNKRKHATKVVEYKTYYELEYYNSEELKTIEVNKEDIIEIHFCAGNFKAE